MHPVLALFARNARANERLRNWCQWQPAAARPAGGDVYGDVAATFNHILAAETRYLRLLTGEMPDDAVSEKTPLPLAELREPIRRLAQRWQAVLAGERAIEEPRTHERGGRMLEMPDWVPLAQAVHHGDDLRAQIGTLLGREKVITPELDGWYFGFEPSSPGIAPVWAETLLRHCVGHHLWATGQLLEHCRKLSAEQLELSAPGTRGSISVTLVHLVSSDRGYLSRLKRGGRMEHLETAGVDTLTELWQGQREGWLAYL